MQYISVFRLGMATAQPTNACPMCMENNIDHRKLPSCAHTFCGPCLITYISKLRDNKELQNGLHCPLCITISPAPLEVDNPADWVNSLEKVTIRIESEGTQHDPICTSCDRQGKSAKATMFCFNCLEKLCEVCMNARHTYTPIKDHKYITVGEAFGANGEDELLQILTENVSCNYHPDKLVEFLCKDDEEFCCSRCIVVKHKKCSHVLEVDVLIKQEQYIEDDKEHVKEMIFRLESYVNDSIKAMKSCLEGNKTQVDEIVNTLQDIRQNINELLDALLNNCQDQSKAAAKRQCLQINENIEKLQTVVETLRGYKNLIDKGDKYCSSAQRYVSTKMLETKLRDLESSVLDTTTCIKGSNISLTQNQLLVDLLNIALDDTAIFASVSESPTDTALPTYDTSTLLRYYKTTKAAEMVVKEKTPYIITPTYTSFAFLPNNNIVLVDACFTGGHCLLATKEGNVVSSCDFLSCGTASDIRPYCVTVLKTDMVAVSLPELKKITVICPHDQMKITNTMTTKYKPQAICGLKHGDLAVAWSDPVAFGIITVDDVSIEKVYFCQDKGGRKLKCFQFMAVDERRSHVIQPCKHDEAVYCFDLEGNPKFKYTNTELQDPSGVALDRDGNIYVCDNSAHAIHVISATGGGIRIVWEGCPYGPAAIAFGKNGEEFAVTKHSGERHTLTFFCLQKSCKSELY